MCAEKGAGRLLFKHRAGPNAHAYGHGNSYSDCHSYSYSDCNSYSLCHGYRYRDTCTHRHTETDTHATAASYATAAYLVVPGIFIKGRAREKKIASSPPTVRSTRLSLSADETAERDQKIRVATVL